MLETKIVVVVVVVVAVCVVVWVRIMALPNYNVSEEYKVVDVTTVVVVIGPCCNPFVAVVTAAAMLAVLDIDVIVIVVDKFVVT